MITTWIGLIGTALTVLVGPLVAFFIKRWWDNQAADKAAALVAAQEQIAATANDQKVSAGTAQVNQEIAAQAAARAQWIKDHPNA